MNADRFDGPYSNLCDAPAAAAPNMAYESRAESGIAAGSCSDDETTVTRPAALQVDLDAAMRSVRQGRCFVRPSGTEDCVRIYAEAATQEEADELTALTHAAIRKHLG